MLEHRSATCIPVVLRLVMAVLVMVRPFEASNETVPFLDITARTLYEGGFQQGQLARARIQGWFRSPEMVNVMKFAHGAGKVTFTQLKIDNTAAFPELVEEIKGIAAGAGVSEDYVWVANLIQELEILMPRRSDHCSDIYAVASGGYNSGFAHGHNEDWSEAVSHFWYFVKYTAAPGANFNSCAGMAYPGTLIGFASSWNAHGIYLTQNTVFPSMAARHGLGSVFAQRDALCGASGSHGLDGVIAALTAKGPWSDGASVNIVDLVSRRMANVEMHENERTVLEVTAGMGNYSHFNMYKHTADVYGLDESSVHRQARADELPAPKSAQAIAAILSDTADKRFPIFRPTTLATYVLDGISAQLHVWCCGSSAISGGPPSHNWNLMTFFDKTPDEGFTVQMV